jgi:hypothetical protein
MDAGLFFDYREMEENRKSQPIHICPVEQEQCQTGSFALNLSLTI